MEAIQGAFTDPPKARQYKKKLKQPKSDRMLARIRHIENSVLDWSKATVQELFLMYGWYRQALMRAYGYETINGIEPFLDEDRSILNPLHPANAYSGLDGFNEFLEFMECIYAPKKPRVRLTEGFYRTLSALYREVHPYKMVSLPMYKVPPTRENKDDPDNILRYKDYPLAPHTMTEAVWALQQGIIHQEEYDELMHDCRLAR